MPRPKGAHNKHKKEKPVKEKKKRGRPSKGSQHQKQKQHQVVNVTINSDGGGGNDKKKKNPLQQAIQSIPNMIFNPSLSIPQGAPINRPETNPPYYDMSSLIQAMQPTQQQPAPPLRAPPTSIMDQIQQVTTSISTNKDKIKDQIKPVNPVIPEPIPQFVPNPQSDQSHPIPPDITIDSNISNPIHNKHVDNKSNIQDIIPQQPKEKK